MTYRIRCIKPDKEKQGKENLPLIEISKGKLKRTLEKLTKTHNHLLHIRLYKRLAIRHCHRLFRSVSMKIFWKAFKAQNSKQQPHKSQVVKG